MNEQYDFLYPSDYHEDEITRAPWYPTDDLIKAAALNLLILDRYERKIRNGFNNGNAVLLFDSEEARNANDLTHAKPMLVDRDSVADKELLLDTETGMRPVLLIDPLTGEKKIGYTEFLIPGYQEVVIDGIATGSYKDADGNPTENENGELYKYPDTRRKYEEDKEYFDSLPAEDRALLLSYLRAKEAIANGVTSFTDEEAPQVYKDYLNRLTSKAYEPIDNLAWLAGIWSAPYYGLRTGLDIARGDVGGALENGVFTALPWASKVGGAIVKNANPFVKEVVGLNAIGAPVTAYNAYNYGPEGAVTTAAMFTAMPMLGEAIKAADIPGVTRSLATLVLDAGERGVEGYKALSRQLSTIYKNVSPEIKKLILDAIDFCNVAIESHDNFDFMNPGGMRTSPAMVKVRTVDGRTIEIPAETANTYLNEGRGSILVNPKESITQNGIADKAKELAGKIGDAYNEGKERLRDAANALRGKRSEVESTPESTIESEAKPNVNNNIIEDQALKQEKELNDAMSSYVKKTDSVFPKDKEVKFGDWIKSTDEITIDGNKTTPKLMFEEFLSPYMESICNRTVSNLEENLDNIGTHWYGGIEGGKHAKYNLREFLRSEGVTNQNTPKKFYRDIEKRFEEISDKIKVSVDDNGTLVFNGGEFEELPKKVLDTILKVAEKIRSSFDESIKLYENTNLNEIIKNNQDKGITLRDILYPEYGKCEDLKNAVLDLYSYKYRDYYLKKSAENKFKSRYIGNTIDALVSAGATGLTGNLTMDDETGDINWFPSIAAGIAAPIALRGAKRSLLGTTSKIGERITKGFKGHTPTYLEWNPELFNTWSNMGNYKHLMYTVPPYLTMGAIKADKYDWLDPASTVFLWPFSTPDPNNKTTTFYLRDEEDQQ